MPSVGETIKRARLERGLELETVAAQTKITARYLQAIESDDRKTFPSGFFYKSFASQYARSLSLDTQAIDVEIDRLLSMDEPLPLPGVERVVSRNLSPLRSDRRFRMRPWFRPAASLAIVVAGCSGIYALWHDARPSLGVRGMQQGIDNLRSIVRSTFAKSAPVTAPAAATVATALSEPEFASTPRSSAIRATAAKFDVARASGVAESNSVAAPPVSPDYKVVVDFVAHEPTWLSVSSDGKPVFSGTLQPNDSKIVNSKVFAKVRVGNAAGIEVRLNGKLLAPLGARGQVLTVLFTPDNFQIFSEPRESD